MVWDETCIVMRDLMDNVWNNTPEIAIPHVLDVTLPVRVIRSEATLLCC